MAKDLVKEISKQIIHTTSLFSVDEKFEDPRFMMVRVAVLHSGINRNNSSFSTKVIKAAKDSFKNIPILADVQKYTDADGNEYLDYSGHSMHIEDDAFDSEKQRIVYDEKVVGIIPESNNFEIIHDDETGNDYAYVDALLFREYGNYVCDILESRNGITDVSAEIACDDVSYSAEDKCLVVGKMQMCGVTLLGDHVTPGMAKAHAQMFSLDTEKREKQLIDIMQELTKALDNYTAVITAKDTEKGGQEVFEELLKQYGKTVDDITFDYEELSEEELKTAFAEAFAEENPEGVKEFDDDDDGEADGDDTDVTDDVETEDEDDPEDTDPEPEPTPEPTPEPDDTKDEKENDDDNDVDDDKKVNYSVSYGECVKEFSVSLSDVIYALSELVNETYADEGSYYGVEVYADDNYVIMMDYYTGKAYKQTFKKKKDCYSLTGDRVPVKAIYVTEDEEKKLDEMRSKYSEVTAKLEKYEAEPDKMKILESDEYRSVCDKAEFVKLKSQEAHFDLSIDEVKAKADAIILDYAKKGALSFSANTETENVKRKTLPMSPKKTNRYGNIFSK